jgi:hypothetical protein
VFRKQAQHVVKKTYAGFNIGVSPAVNIKPYRNFRFRSFPAYFSLAHPIASHILIL